MPVFFIQAGGSAITTNLALFLMFGGESFCPIPCKHKTLCIFQISMNVMEITDAHHLKCVSIDKGGTLVNVLMAIEEILLVGACLYLQQAQPLSILKQLLVIYLFSSVIHSLVLETSFELVSRLLKITRIINEVI